MRHLAAAAALLIGHAAGAQAQPGCPPGLALALFPTLAGTGAWRSNRDASRVLREREARIGRCGDTRCAIDAQRWTAAERRILVGSARTGPGGGGITGKRFAERSAAIGREIDGIDGIIDVYAVDKAPRYPAIDGPDDPPNSAARERRIADALGMAAACRPPRSLGDPSIGLATALLTVNDRTDAVRFPAGPSLNGAAAGRARGTDWRRYRYAALVVLGVGPDDPAVRLSAAGESNVRLAADRFERGLAPFIVVTGGAVHPRRTRIVEAVEMRRDLIERFHVPAAAIVLEPRARHTTTNLRNVARELRRIGAPAGKDVLVLTNAEHSASISNPAFAQRNERELGYQPGKVVARLGPTDLAYRLFPRSLRIDPRDPLDP